MIYRYKGYLIRKALPTGGKAGKGHNATSSYTVYPESFVPGSFRTNVIRFKVGDVESQKVALRKCAEWIDRQVADENQSNA